MYRIITGACEQGTKQFVTSLNNIKKYYTVNEIIILTRGQYGNNSISKYFTNNKVN